MLLTGNNSYFLPVFDIPNSHEEPISCLAKRSLFSLASTAQPQVSISPDSSHCYRRHLTQACVKFCPHVPAPASLDRLLFNSKTTQVSHERYHDHVSLKAKPSFAFDETGYLDDERLFLGIEAIIASMECFDYSETTEVCEVFRFD